MKRHSSLSLCIVFASTLLPALCSVHGQTSEPVCSRSDVIFCTGFEEQNWKSLWDDYDGNPDPPNHLEADPGPFNIAGNHVMHIIPSQSRGGGDLVKVFGSSYDSLYARWYQKWPAGYNFSSACHGNALFAGDRNYLGQSGNRPSGSDFATLGFEHCSIGRHHFYAYYRGMFEDCADPNGSCWGDEIPCMPELIGSQYCTNPAYNAPPGPLPPAVVANVWYCFEIFVKMGTPSADTNAVKPDGSVTFWQDGVQFGPYGHMWMRTTPNLKLNILWMQLFHHDSLHTLAGTMWDDIVVAQHRIGLAGISAGGAPRLPVPFGIKVQAAVWRDVRFAVSMKHAAAYSLTVVNSAGRVVWTYEKDKAAAGVEIVAPRLHFPNGLYYISMKYQDEIITQKFIVTQ